MGRAGKGVSCWVRARFGFKDLGRDHLKRQNESKNGASPRWEERTSGRTLRERRESLLISFSSRASSSPTPSPIESRAASRLAGAVIRGGGLGDGVRNDGRSQQKVLK